jgi:Colicin V production protein
MTLEMPMALAMTIVVALVLLLLTLVGAGRDLQRGALALGGSLLGVVLGELWGARLGAAVVDRMRVSPPGAVFLVQALLLLGSSLVLGYGSGTLLSPHARALTWRRRVVGGLMGLLNGVVLVGFLLQYGAATNAGLTALVGQSALAGMIHAGLPALFMLGSAGAGVLVIGKLAVGTLRARQAPPPSYSRAAAPEADPLSPSYERRLNQRRALDKVSDKLNEIEHGR